MKNTKNILYTLLVLMLTINLNINAQNKSNNQQEIEEVDEVKKTQSVQFRFIENPPTYPGCENLKGREAKDCMSKNVTAFVSKNFNTDIPSNLGISGKVKILTQFTIDTNGQVTNVKARSKYKELSNEAKRVVRLLPKMKSGIQRGKPVKVTYTLPIIFNIEEDLSADNTLETTPAIFPGCAYIADNFGKKKCSDQKLQEFIIKNINNKMLANLGLKGHKVVKAEFIVNEKGNMQNLVTKSPYKKLNNEIKKVLQTLPKMIPAKKNGKTIKTQYLLPVFFNFGHDENEVVMEKVYEFKEDENGNITPINSTVDFIYIHNPPTYPGCENLKADASKKCMSRKVQQFVGQNFDGNIAAKLKLKGIIKILTSFVINKKGEVIDVHARSKYKVLSDEAKRVIKLIPKMKPGTQKGKPVRVTYKQKLYSIIIGY